MAALSRARIAPHKSTVTYHVEGFICLACAAGLEALLGKAQGVLAVTATYPEALTTISYNANKTSEASLSEAIERMGFRARRLSSTVDAQPAQ